MKNLRGEKGEIGRNMEEKEKIWKNVG